jgi:AcrR family transcriptional regulator
MFGLCPLAGQALLAVGRRMSSKGKRSSKAKRLPSGKGRGAGRTHAERSSDTQEKVIQAAIRCIAEYGYQQATVTRIADLSGVSWGGIQHQFGNKAAIIQAVLDHALDEFVMGVQGISTQDDQLETRVKVLVEGAWRLVNRPGFLAFLEIVLSHRHEPPKRNPAWRYTARVWKVMIAVWDHLFGSLELSDDQVQTARRVTFSSLTGMAVESVVRTDSPSFERPWRCCRRTS